MRNGLSFIPADAQLVSIKDRLTQSTYLRSMFGVDLSDSFSAKKADESVESAVAKGRLQLFKDFARGLNFRTTDGQLFNLSKFEASNGATAGSTELKILQSFEAALSEDPRLLPHLPALFQHFNQQAIYGIGANYINVMQFNGMFSMMDNGHIQVGVGNESKQIFVADDGRVHLIIKRQLGFKSIIGRDDMFHAIDDIEETYILDDEHGFILHDVKSSGNPLTTLMCNRDMAAPLPEDVKKRIFGLMQKSLEAHQQSLARKAEIARLETALAPVTAITVQQYSKASSIESVQKSSVVSGGLTAFVGGLLGFCVAGPIGLAAGATVGGLTGATTKVGKAPVHRMGEYLKHKSQVSHNSQVQAFMAAHEAEMARYQELRDQEALEQAGPQLVKEDAVVAVEEVVDRREAGEQISLQHTITSIPVLVPRFTTPLFRSPGSSCSELLTRLYRSAHDQEVSRQYAERYTAEHPDRAEAGFGPFAVALRP